MLHDDMTLYRLLVYAKSMEEYNLWTRGRDFTKGRPNEKGQTRFKKRALNEDVPSCS